MRSPGKTGPESVEPVNADTPNADMVPVVFERKDPQVTKSGNTVAVYPGRKEFLIRAI